MDLTARRTRWLAATAAIVAAFSAQETAAQDFFVVAGRVIERESRSPVRAATVELPGRPPTLSDANGEFRFIGVPRGRYTLNVEAIGYGAAAVEFVLRADTSLTVELDVRPVALDSVEARVRYVTFRGRVVDARDASPIFDADVYLGLDERTSTNSTGGFRFGRVPASAPNTIEVRALGFMPEQRVVEAIDDTTLTFELRLDPIAARMVEIQRARLESRLDAVPYSSQLMTREDIQRYPNWSGKELVESRVPLHRVACLIIDEMQIRDRNILSSYMPEEIERIEILRNRQSSLQVTARIYTRRFLQRMVAGAIQLRDLPASRIAACN